MIDLREVILLVCFANRHPGITLEKLARKFGLKEKEVKRALELATLCGLPDYTPFDLIEVDFEDSRVYVRFADYLSRPVSLSLLEALSIIWSAGLLAKCRLKGVKALEQAVAKIKATFSQELASEVEDLAQRREIIFEDVDEKVLDTIEDCIGSCFVAEMVYHSVGRDELSKRLIDPYLLVVERGKWYLVGYCHRHQEMRRFLVSRIKSIKKLKKKFTKVPFKPEEYSKSYRLEDEIEVKIFYSEEAARFIRERVGPRRREDLLNGGCIVTLGTRSFAGIVKHWVLPYRAHAKIISPPELKNFYLKELDSMLSLYEGGD